MKPLTIILRSLGVFCLAGLVLVPIRLSYSGDADSGIAPDVSDETIRIVDPIDSLITDEPNLTIFEIPHFAYLADENSLRQANYANRPIKDTENRVIVAKDLAEQKQFRKALAILSNVQISDQSNYDVKFLRARILSWDGQYYSAEQEFQALRRQYPQDADIMVAYGYLQYYQNRLANAESLFQQVLRKYPDYEDARRGLVAAQNARRNIP